MRVFSRRALLWAALVLTIVGASLLYTRKLSCTLQPAAGTAAASHDQQPPAESPEAERRGGVSSSSAPASSEQENGVASIATAAVNPASDPDPAADPANSGSMTTSPPPAAVSAMASATNSNSNPNPNPNICTSPLQLEGAWINPQSSNRTTPLLEMRPQFVNTLGERWIQRQECQLPQVTPEYACRLLEPFGTISVLGDSNTRQFLIALLMVLTGDMHRGAMPNQVWNEEPGEVALRNALRPKFTSDAALARGMWESVWAKCSSPHSLFGAAMTDPCRGFYARNHSVMNEERRPCHGRLKWNFVSRGNCTESYVRNCLTFAGSGGLAIMGFGVHMGYDADQVSSALQTPLEEFKAVAKPPFEGAPSVFWLEPLRRDESMIARKYIEEAGQSNSRRDILSHTVEEVLNNSGLNHGILNGAQVAFGAETRDGSHIGLPGNLVRVQIFLAHLEELLHGKT